MNTARSLDRGHSIWPRSKSSISSNLWKIVNRHFSGRILFAYCRIVKCPSAISSNFHICECWKVESKNVRFLIFLVQWQFSRVISLHRKSIHRIYKVSNYTQRFIWWTVFKINIRWPTDVFTLSCTKQHNNNMNNNYCSSTWCLIADLFKCMKLKKSCYNLSTVNWTFFIIFEIIQYTIFTKLVAINVNDSFHIKGEEFLSTIHGEKF